MPEEKPSKRNPLVWESDVIRLPNGRVELVAREPMKNISAKQAAKLLGVSTWTVTDLYRLGLLDGFKPGARKLSAITQSAPPENHLLGLKVHHLRM